MARGDHLLGSHRTAWAQTRVGTASEQLDTCVSRGWKTSEAGEGTLRPAGDPLGHRDKRKEEMNKPGKLHEIVRGQHQG